MVGLDHSQLPFDGTTEVGPFDVTKVLVVADISADTVQLAQNLEPETSAIDNNKIIV